MSSKKGFTMIELLVVLVIVAILAAVAAPLYLANTKKSKMAEAIATMGLIRQAERDYKVNHNAYFDILEVTTQDLDAGNIKNAFPSSMTDVPAGTPSPTSAGVDMNVGTTQYFSNNAYFADANTAAGSIGSIRTVATGLFTNPPPVDFIVSARGANSFPCSTTSPSATQSCATKASEVKGTSGTTDFEAVMDNSGRTFVCYGVACDTAANWSAY